MLKIKIIFLLLPFSMVSQNLKGKIYDNESTAKGVQVINITQNIKTYSDENGNFTIKAVLNDSLKFKSLFHHEKFLIISKEHFSYQLVVELKKIVNELGEVLLSDTSKSKAFNPIDYTQNVSLGIAEDMRMNAHLYKPTPAGGFDVKALALEIIKLFKKKKSEDPAIKFISYKTLDSLFSNDRFFNKQLLKEDLHIEDNFKPLFFDYCDAKGLDTKLLDKENQFILLDSLMHFSKDFQMLVETSKKE